MTKPKSCNATVDLGDKRTLTCALPAGHDGPTHQDKDGEAWGDQLLPVPQTLSAE